MMCLLMPPCVASNFVLMQRNSADGTYFAAHNLSAASTPQIVTFIQSLKRKANVYVSVTGTVDADGAIVVSKIKDAVVSCS